MKVKKLKGLNAHQVISRQWENSSQIPEKTEPGWKDEVFFQEKLFKD